ncbi:hypothetical protein L209DRAFT_611471 [Thermothelomyces heterothallicus CBS 203.75]
MARLDAILTLPQNAPIQREQNQRAACRSRRQSITPETRPAGCRLDMVAQEAAAQAVPLHARGGAATQEDTRDPGQGAGPAKRDLGLLCFSFCRRSCHPAFRAWGLSELGLW